ncbi:hypothetical protein F8M41_023469 [Gigaspora margarita]|uniref:Uncharacterized protein n=1 Tax=Gigaspora margarita TaxID=4874 RepID=A0A8H4EH87_GIGMA|nr:hypothetical protein F8M41_023469 [Gigaspora margarita]
MNIIKIISILFRKKDLQHGFQIFGILIIFLSLSITGVMAQDKSCQVVMCIKTGGSVAVAVSDGTSSRLSQAQNYIFSECSGVTNTTSCYVDCKGPYAGYGNGAYWKWKSCSALGWPYMISYVCDSTIVLDVCTLGGDPNYPFNTNTTTSTNSPAPQSNSNPAKPNTANSNPAQENNCSYRSTCINNFHSQANQADTKFYFISRLLLVITILLCDYLL